MAPGRPRPSARPSARPRARPGRRTRGSSAGGVGLPGLRAFARRRGKGGCRGQAPLLLGRRGQPPFLSAVSSRLQSLEVDILLLVSAEKTLIPIPGPRRSPLAPVSPAAGTRAPRQAGDRGHRLAMTLAGVKPGSSPGFKPNRVRLRDARGRQASGCQAAASPAGRSVHLLRSGPRGRPGDAASQERPRGLAGLRAEAPEVYGWPQTPQTPLILDKIKT